MESDGPRLLSDASVTKRGDTTTYELTKYCRRSRGYEEAETLTRGE